MTTPPPSTIPLTLTPAEITGHHLPLLQALDYAFDPDKSDDTTAPLLTGLATRPDLTPQIIDRLLDHATRCYRTPGTLLAALLNNPHAPLTTEQTRLALNLGDGYTLLALLTRLDHPTRHRATLVGRALHDQPDALGIVHEALRTTFTPHEIAAELDHILDPHLDAITDPNLEAHHYDLPVDTLRSALFDETHLDRLLTAITDTLRDHAPKRRRKHHTYLVPHAAEALAVLGTRTDLTPDQTDRYADALLHLTRWFPPEHHHWPRILTGTLRYPHPTQVRLLSHPLIRQALARTGWPGKRPTFSSAAFTQAARDGHDIIDLIPLYHPRLTATAAHALLDIIGHHPQPIRTLNILLPALTQDLDTPPWDDCWSLWAAHAEHDMVSAAAADEFVARCLHGTIPYADFSTTQPTERLRAWLAAHDSPHLRRHAVRLTTLPEQVAAALRDPHPLVRAEILTHPTCTHAHVVALADDPDPDIRRTAAQHLLDALT